MLKNQVRIIGGKWRGRKISFLDTTGLRPSPDRVRETLFNWLTPFLANTTCLDLFAGSGALGFEALSRGARKTIFVDKSRLVIQQIQKIQQQLNAQETEFYCEDAIDFLKHSPTTFDIIFLDPPFHQNILIPSIKLIEERSLLNHLGHLYIVQPKNEKLISIPAHWKILKEKQAGQVLFQLIRNI